MQALYGLAAQGMVINNVLRMETNFGDTKYMSTNRGKPEPWPINPRPNGDKPSRVLLFEYYLLDLYTTWKETNNPMTPIEYNPQSVEEPIIIPYRYEINP